MQQLQRVFQFSMTALVCLSAITFAAAEGSPLAMLTVPAAMVSWVAVDRPGRRGLSPLWSFVLGLGALAAAGFELATGTVEARILAPAHLLCYLQWIILFQHKETRHYWILLGLTVLQVAIASLLTVSPAFGAAVIVYAALALWSMGVFTLQRGVQQVSAGGEVPPGAARHPGSDAARRAPAIAGRHSTVRNSVQLDPTERLIGWHFTGGALVMTVLSLTLSGMFFLFIPRIWPNQSRLFNTAPIAGNRPLTGFTEQVTLGDMGEILESNDLVLEVQLFDHDSGAAISPENYLKELGSADPLFRGQVMEVYVDARWQRSNYEDMSRPGGWGARPRFPVERHTLRQRIRLQPIGTTVLFAAGRVLTCHPVDADETIYPEPYSGSFRRGDEGDFTHPFEYDAYSSRNDSSHRGIRSADYREYCLLLPRGFERLVALVREIAPSDARLTTGERADRLLRYLRDSDEFSYSLDLSVHDPKVDPVIDFLFNRRRGHCEYYASTLALMLRAAGIPSRLISGFKGGQLNSQTGRFEVRQLHAHAWVEAYIDGIWVPLDPTPPDRDENVAQLQQQSASLVRRWRDAWERAWTHGVRLSRSDQDRLIYEPLRDGALGLWNAVRDLEGTSSRLGEFVRNLLNSPKRWFSWRGGLAAFALLLIGSLLVSVVRRIWAMLSRLGSTGGEDRRSALLVGFYERFRRAAARGGYQRASTQTPREFALAVSRGIQSRPEQHDLVPLPGEVTEHYYRVRFGGEPLPPEVLERLQRRLDEFERELPQRRATGRVAAAST